MLEVALIMGFLVFLAIVWLTHDTLPAPREADVYSIYVLALARETKLPPAQIEKAFRDLAVRHNTTYGFVEGTIHAMVFVDHIRFEVAISIFNWESQAVQKIYD